MLWSYVGRRAALLAAAGAMLSAFALAPAWPSAAAAGPCEGAECDVSGDPANAAYVGEGGLLIPRQTFVGEEGDRASAATCPGCRWALVATCKRGVIGGTTGCGPAALSCEAGRRMIIYLMRPGETSYRQVGTVCVGLTGPVTVEDFADQLRDVVIERVPPQLPSYQPAGGALVNLPVLFASGQQRRLDSRAFELVGFEVVLDARASWTWRFGDGAELVTDEPGGGWPVRTVAHTYREPGLAQVVVVTTWQAWFTVDDLGPFPVGGDVVEQVAGPIDLPVREARAVLVGG